MRNIVAQSNVILAPNGRPAFLEALENNWYEASRWSPNRSWIWQPVQDAKKDLDRFTRMELCKRARYLYKNSPLIRGVIERMVTLIVGSGFHYVFKSSSDKWNKRAEAWWKKKSRSIHLGPRATFVQYQRAIVRARLLDGECFSILTQDDTVTFQSLIQGVECDRICGIRDKNSSPELQEFNHSGMNVDGFNLNQQGIIVSYNLRGVDNPYDAEYVVQHFTPNRLGQYRGETILAAAINTAQDVDDILALEKDCVKDSSSHKDIIKTASGQLDPETFRKLRYGQQFPTVFNLPPDNQTHDDYYRVQFGAKPIVMRKGDEYTPYIPNRPGAAWQGFMDFLSNTICASTGFPVSVMLPISIGGTDIRRDLDIAQKVVEPFQNDTVCELDTIMQYLIESETVDGDLRQDLPTDNSWKDHAWMMPQRVNVDRSQAQQDREDVGHGLMSREEYHGRYGESADEVDATIIKEAKKRKESILAAGFEEVKEFVEVISLDSKMFMTRSQDDESLKTGVTPNPTPEPAQK